MNKSLIGHLTAGGIASISRRKASMSLASLAEACPILAGEEHLSAFCFGRFSRLPLTGGNSLACGFNRFSGSLCASLPGSS